MEIDEKEDEQIQDSDEEEDLAILIRRGIKAGLGSLESKHLAMETVRNRRREQHQDEIEDIKTRSGEPAPLESSKRKTRIGVSTKVIRKARSREVARTNTRKLIGNLKKVRTKTWDRA